MKRRARFASRAASLPVLIGLGVVFQVAIWIAVGCSEALELLAGRPQ